MPQKIVINAGATGAFDLSEEAALRLRERGHPLAQRMVELEERARREPSPGRGVEGSLALIRSHAALRLRGIDRTDPDLIAVVEELGPAAAGGPGATLKVVEVPDDADWEIEHVHGREWVAETHRTWS
jgi:hypothetical protein